MIEETNNLPSQDVADSERSGDRRPPPCSASSDLRETPETKDAYQQRDGEGAMDHEIRRARTMEKLERERNAAWKTLKEIRELFTADESFGATVEALFSKPLEEAEAEIARLNSLLNAKIAATVATE